LEEAAAAKACVGHAVSASVHMVNNVKSTNEYNVDIGVAQKRINIASIR
jgi:hypothetical protein